MVGAIPKMLESGSSAGFKIHGLGGEKSWTFTHFCGHQDLNTDIRGWGHSKNVRVRFTHFCGQLDLKYMGWVQIVKNFVAVNLSTEELYTTLG